MQQAKPWLILCTACIFLGRAYQYLWWDAPLRVFFWDEQLLAPVVEGLLGRPWRDYATDPRVTDVIGRVQQFIGVGWLVGAAAALAAFRSVRAWQVASLVGGTAFLVAHALLETKDHFYHLAQFGEHLIQIATPLLLLGLLRWGWPAGRLYAVGRAAVAVTFAAHGLYALGFHPVPVHFVDMTMLALGVGEGTARTFLAVVGWLDLGVAAALFVPRLVRYALGYVVVWGLLTALARVVSGAQVVALAEVFHHYGYRTVFRLPHGLLGVALLALRRHLALLGADAGAGERR